jgi:gamma-glutamylcysteine synthetase
MKFRCNARWKTFSYWHHDVDMAIGLGQYMQVKTMFEELGIRLAGIGSQPKWHVDVIPIMPKV